MKTYLHLLLLFILLTGTAFSFQDLSFRYRVKTGSCSSQFYTTNAGPVLYCAGIDKNFNGIQDEGDEPPSLWHLEQYFMTLKNKYIAPEAIKLTDLEFKVPMLPVRNFFDESTKRLYIANANSIDTFSFDDHDYTKLYKGRLLDSIPNISAVSAYGDKVFISVRPSSDKGLVLVYDIPSRKITDTITAGAGVQQTQYYGAAELLFILCEGTFGNNDGKLIVAHFFPNDSIAKNEISIGGTPNHFYYSERTKKALITCNASQQVLIFNNDMSVDTLKLNTTGYDGPRETVPMRLFFNQNFDNLFITTAYNGKVYLLSADSKIIDSLDAYGKAESVYSNKDLIIATPFMLNSYTPDTAVTVYSGPESVTEKADNLFSVFPNPASDKFSITQKEDMIISDVEIFNSMGVKVIDYNNPASMNFEFALNPGLYFVRIKHNLGVSTLPLTVIR